MKEIFNGIEIQGTNKETIGIIYFDSGHMYIACGKEKLPIIIKNIRSETIKQIGEFFGFFGNYPERAATQIDFNNQYVNIRFKIDSTYFYIITKGISLEFYPLGPIEIKKMGAWLRKQAKGSEES